VAASGNVSEHFFVPVRKRWRVIRLLELSFNLAPLHSADGNVIVVGARARTIHLGYNPGRGGFWIRLVNFCSDQTWLHEIDILVVVLRSRHLRS